MKILVVDDVMANRYLLIALFRGHGFEVVEAENGVQALEQARRAPPDLVVTDLMMPEMDGFELCRQWKRDERLKSIPFVVYTATYTDPKDERLALGLGADRFLIKPQKPEDLVALARELLERVHDGSPSLSPSTHTDEELLRQHNEALTRKLQKKVRELEAEVRRCNEIEAALRDSERRFRLLAENALDVVWSMGFDGRFTYLSPSIEKLRGYTPEEAMNQSLEEILMPEGVRRFREEMAPVMADLAAGREPQRSGVFELEQPCKDGSTVWTEVTAGIMRDDEGRAVGIQGVSRDITERKRAEREHDRLQASLLQAQKLESVGRLASAISHDFNNMLAVILSSAAFAAEALKHDDPVQADIVEIRKAGDRAAALTRQLLAFSRQQILAPQVISLNRAVLGIVDMLRRLLGEDVRVETVLAGDIANVLADPGQIEQVIMNLAVNARDAMPGGGRFTLETRNVELDDEYASEHPGVEPGHYVMLGASDTGCGMDAATRQRVFDPFFTTKEKGRGTGLGLSTVHGIVRQSGGHVWVYSEPGHGTVFKVYLPSVNAPETAISKPSASATDSGDERVLVVEDEAAVRRVVERMLRSAGYDVLVADSGDDAMRVCDSLNVSVDLLLTDVVMPEMGGRELADRMIARHPHLKVLYMSGYTDDGIVKNNVLDSAARFIAKPFSAAELRRKVREVLDEPGAHR